MRPQVMEQSEHNLYGLNLSRVKIMFDGDISPEQGEGHLL